MHTPLLAQTSIRKALRQLHLLEMDMFSFPGEPGDLSLGANPLITERWQTHSSPCQEPTSHSHSCLSLSAHIPICKRVLPFDLKVTHLKFTLSSFFSSLPESSLNSHLHLTMGPPAVIWAPSEVRPWSSHIITIYTKHMCNTYLFTYTFFLKNILFDCAAS